MVFIRQAFLFIFLILLFINKAYCANPVLVQVDSSEPWGFSYTPESTIHPEKKMSGIWIDILKKLSELTQIDFQVSLAPYARVVQNLEHGKTDLSFLTRPDRDSDQIIYVTEMFTISTVVVSQINNNINTYEDLMGKRIGIVRGSRLETRFDNDNSLIKQSFRNYEIIVTMLFQNRLDAIVGDAISIRYLLRKNGISSEYCNNFTLKVASVWIQLSTASKQKQIVELLVRANQRLKRDGVYQKILEKYSNSLE